MADEVIKAWVDGASTGEVGPGGWGVVIQVGDQEYDYSGRSPKTTNQRMEMIAALMAMTLSPKGSVVEIHSDSAYVVNCMNRAWWSNWHTNGWKNAQGKPVANRDLWERLLEAVDRHDEVRWIKVKGHANDELNNRADELAVAAKKEAQKQMKAKPSEATKGAK